MSDALSTYGDYARLIFFLLADQATIESHICRCLTSVHNFQGRNKGGRPFWGFLRRRSRCKNPYQAFFPQKSGKTDVSDIESGNLKRICQRISESRERTRPAYRSGSVS